MAAKEYRTSLQFPAHYGEQIVVRDGRGRAVERWTVSRIEDGKHHRFITFSQYGYVAADRL